jgi:hypothetical protein
MTVPVDLLKLTILLGFVVVVEDRRELSVGITRGLVGGGSADSLEPVGGEVLACE